MPINQKKQHLVNIWEVHSCFICPVVGLCFSDFEIKKILKTPGNLKLTKMDSYSLHQAVMAKLEDKNNASEKANRLLKDKYAKTLERFGTMAESDFQKVWTKNLLSRTMPAMLYVAASRRDFSADFLIKIYGDVHMGGYRAMSAMWESFQEKEVVVEKNKELKRRLSELKGHNVELVDKNIKLKAENNRNLMFFVSEINKTPTQSVDGNLVDALEKQLSSQARKMNQLERERRKTEIDMFEAVAINKVLEKELNQLIAGFTHIRSTSRCTSGTCPDFDTCSRRILIVGGLTKLKEMYRKIVESNGGIFDYHSGRIRNRKNNLEAQVKRSDLIICPVNHNSHSACLKVKQFCNKHNKSLVNNHGLKPAASLFGNNAAGRT